MSVLYHLNFFNKEAQYSIHTYMYICTCVYHSDSYHISYASITGINGQTYTTTIVSNPVGTPVDSQPNTFDYPILSSVTLTCNVTSDDGSPFTVMDYSWDTTGCYVNNRNERRCFPAGQTTQTVSEDDLLARDAGTITCTATISGIDYTSPSFTLRISGINT